MLICKSGVITQQDLSLGGGTEKSRFFASAGYFKQDGIAVGVNYVRGNFRLNTEHIISKVFTFGENRFISYSKQRYDNTSGNRTRLVNVIPACLTCRYLILPPLVVTVVQRTVSMHPIQPTGRRRRTARQCYQ